ncbi:MAG: methyltransferase domain-containing protein [Gammaproteobacteria bacterium]|nr:methyltransferase domain-containing protein [Gammaproteobacteria bacterium]
MNRQLHTRGLTVLLCMLCVAACGRDAPDTENTAESATAESAAVAPAAASIYDLAVASESRLDGDQERDAGRKPAEVLEFLGIAPGMAVLDMFSGGGYYAELLSNVVGADGRVVAHSNEAYLKFVGDEFTKRFGADRLSNVDIMMAENNQLMLDADSFDAVMMVLSFHDLVLDDPENGWEKIDSPAFLAELYKSLRPGGIVGIVDHYAEAGASADSGNTVHRIDPAIVIADMEAAGFEMDGQSQVLRNPDDDYSRNVFEKDIRGKSDRFVLRFRKPG